jgi:AGCS family alanine or glycine:cation symporter
MEFVTKLFTVLEDLTWGWSLIPILVIFGVFMTIVTGFVQVRYFGRMFRVLVGRDPNADPNQISAREALLVSVGGRVGGGNIAGVAVAITLGGPGAVFWMWAIALVGMCTSLVECTLAQVYKTTAADGTFRGGPAAYIRRGLGAQYGWLAVLYAFCLIGSFAFGFNAFQGNTIAGAVNDSLGIERLWTGIFLAAVTGFIIYGGIRRIAKVADVVVPVMALTYIAVALLIVVMNIGELPRVFGMIVANAFGLQEAVGGGMGAAIAQGLRRGLFSNEAGLGSAPNVAATADVHHPVSQGITQSLSVFIDTILICSATLRDPAGQRLRAGRRGRQRHRANPAVAGVSPRFLGAVLPDLRGIPVRIQLDHLQLIPRRDGIGRADEERRLGACAAGGGDPDRAARRQRTGRHLGILLLRPADGAARAGQPDGRADAVPGGDARAERLPRPVEGR